MYSQCTLHCTQAPKKPETRLSPNLFLALLKFLLLQVDEFFIGDSRDPSIKSERLEPDTETRLHSLFLAHCALTRKS